MAEILAIGEALVELNQPKDGAPFAPGFGGDTSNAMIAAARLGARAGYFTAVGADRFGAIPGRAVERRGRRRERSRRQRRRAHRALFRHPRPGGPFLLLSACGIGGEPH